MQELIWLQNIPDVKKLDIMIVRDSPTRIVIASIISFSLRRSPETDKIFEYVLEMERMQMMLTIEESPPPFQISPITAFCGL